MTRTRSSQDVGDVIDVFCHALEINEALKHVFELLLHVDDKQRCLQFRSTSAGLGLLRLTASSYDARRPRQPPFHPRAS